MVNFPLNRFIKATASESYTFENWSGDEIGSSNIISVTMDENKTLTANFNLTLFILIAMA